jgi:hypothetical protein
MLVRWLAFAFGLPALRGGCWRRQIIVGAEKQKGWLYLILCDRSGEHRLGLLKLRGSRRYHIYSIPLAIACAAAKGAASSICNLADMILTGMPRCWSLFKHLIRGPCEDLMHVLVEQSLARNLQSQSGGWLSPNAVGNDEVGMAIDVRAIEWRAAASYWRG